MAAHTATSEHPRPTLFTVAPLTASICWIFAAVNTIVGLALLYLYEPTQPILVVNSVFTFDVWGYIFLLLAVFGVFAIVTNDWELIKKTLLAGLLVKCIWLIALIGRSLVHPRTTVLLTAIWVLFALVQAVTYVFFLPPTAVTPSPHDEQQQ